MARKLTPEEWMECSVELLAPEQPEPKEQQGTTQLVDLSDPDKQKIQQRMRNMGLPEDFITFLLRFG